VYPDAVPRETCEQLRRAFAPGAAHWSEATRPRHVHDTSETCPVGAAYWSETRYASASAEKRYFTWYVDLASPPSPHEDVVTRLVRRLAPLAGELAGEVAPQSAEWWVHSRGAGRGVEGGGRAARLRAPVWPAPPHPSSLRTGVGHELHYDVEEGALEAGGEVLSPASSPPSSASPYTQEEWSK